MFASLKREKNREVYIIFRIKNLYQKFLEFHFKSLEMEVN